MHNALGLGLIRRDDARVRHEQRAVQLDEFGGHVQAAGVAHDWVADEEQLRRRRTQSRQLRGQVLQHGRAAEVTGEQVRALPQQTVGREAVKQVVELGARQLGALKVLVARVVGQLHRVDRVHVKAVQLQRKCRRLVSDAAVHDSALHGEDATNAIRGERHVVVRNHHVVRGPPVQVRG